MKLHRPCVALAGILFAMTAANAGAQTARTNPFPFSTGETLTYNVNWSVFPAGKITATLTREKKDSDDAFIVTTTASSQGFVSLLFKVQDEFRSEFNPETLCSIRISKKINEGHRHKVSKLTFDSDRGVAILDEHNLNDAYGPPKHAEHEIPPCVEDVVSAFYFVRNQPLHVGQKIKLAVNDGSKTATVIVAVTARKKIQTPLGTHEALRVEPSVFGNLYEKRKGRLVIWFSDDQYHYPLRIKAMLKLGSLTGTLTSITPAPPEYSLPSTTGKEVPKKPAEAGLK
ncbi:MAG: DUF3108 domain-containing protein [Acidobacteriota bacterium]